MPRERREPSTSAALALSMMMSEGAICTSELRWWFAERQQARGKGYGVSRRPLDELEGWHVDAETGNVVHETGRFFTIEGVEVATNFGLTHSWSQPIVVQPEIGILGFLAREIDGLLHVLVQAKMEPGNVGQVQLSPTVQATRSNYTQAHGGAQPRLLDYFLHRAKHRVIADQLQSENNARFLRKRNRNMIVEIEPDDVPPAHEDFRWVTLGQLHGFLKDANTVNMDSRTVLSAVRVGGDRCVGARDVGRFGQAVLESALALDPTAENSLDEVLSWLTELKATYELRMRTIPLDDVHGWHRTAYAIEHESSKYFSIIGVEVSACTREVPRWCQPLVAPKPGGTVALLCQVRRGVLHFLMQGRVEVGSLEVVEVAPTVQCVASNHDRGDLPPYYDRVMSASQSEVRFDVQQSDEGGRFFRAENRHCIVELPPDEVVDSHPNYLWMTLAQLKELVRFNNLVNVEGRSLVACLGWAMCEQQ